MAVTVYIGYGPVAREPAPVISSWMVEPGLALAVKSTAAEGSNDALVVTAAASMAPIEAVSSLKEDSDARIPKTFRSSVFPDASTRKP